MERPRPSLLLSETDATGHNADKYPGKRHTHPSEEQDNGTHARYRPVSFPFHRQSTGHDDGLPSGQHPPAGSYNRQDFPPAARHPVFPRFGRCSSFRHRRFYPSGKTLLYRVAGMPSRFSHHPLKKAEPGHTGIRTGISPRYSPRFPWYNRCLPHVRVAPRDGHFVKTANPDRTRNNRGYR